MFISIFGIQISVLGLTALLLGVCSMALLIWQQKMTWYIWILWIAIAGFWFTNAFLYQDVASMIDNTIAFILAVAGLITLFGLKKKKKRRRKK